MARVGPIADAFTGREDVGELEKIPAEGRLFGAADQPSGREERRAQVVELLARGVFRVLVAQRRKPAHEA